jgi:hypothetical protein
MSKNPYVSYVTIVSLNLATTPPRMRLYTLWARGASVKTVSELRGDTVVLIIVAKVTTGTG